MQQHQFQLFADYHQLYLANDDEEVHMPEEVSDEDIERRLAVGPFILVVHTARDMDVPVTVRVHDAAPAYEADDWQHIAECSIDVPTGRLVVAGCTDYWPDAARIDVHPGLYRARACFRGLDTLSEDGVNGNDEYLIDLWRAPAESLVVAKRYPR